MSEARLHSTAYSSVHIVCTYCTVALQWGGAPEVFATTGAILDLDESASSRAVVPVINHRGGGGDPRRRHRRQVDARLSLQSAIDFFLMAGGWMRDHRRPPFEVLPACLVCVSHPDGSCAPSLLPGHRDLCRPCPSPLRNPLGLFLSPRLPLRATMCKVNPAFFFCPPPLLFSPFRVLGPSCLLLGDAAVGSPPFCLVLRIPTHPEGGWDTARCAPCRFLGVWRGGRCPLVALLCSVLATLHPPSPIPVTQGRQGLISTLYAHAAAAGTGGCEEAAPGGLRATG